MKNIANIFLISVALNLNVVKAQSDIGSGNAILLNGTTSYVDLGDVYNDLTLPITVEAWIYVSPDQTDWGPVFVSQEGTKLKYYGFWLFVKRDAISIGYGDGQGGYHPAFRRSKTASVLDISNKWVHVSGTIRGKTDMTITVNGIDVGGAYTGYSNLPMMNSIGSDNTVMGRDIQNTKTYWYSGEVDEIRLWNYTRSVFEIQKDMCQRVDVNAAGLIGYWNFNLEVPADKIVLDQSQLKNNSASLTDISFLYSGAAIGDVSTSLYSYNFSGQSLQLKSGFVTANLTEISGTTRGIQLYLINSIPNSTEGLLKLNEVSEIYVGVFTSDPSYLFNFYRLGIEGYSLEYERENNSDLIWSNITDLSNQPDIVRNDYHGEYIFYACEQLELLEFPDAVICEGDLYNLNFPDKYSYKLNNQTISQSFSIANPGQYDLLYYNNCYEKQLTANVEFDLIDETLIAFTDTLICSGESYFVVLPELYNYELNGVPISYNYNVSDPGEFELKIYNNCQERSVFAKVNILPFPEVIIAPAFDLCVNEKIEVTPEFYTDSLLWSTGAKTPKVVIDKPGSYWVEAFNRCYSKKIEFHVEHSNKDIEIANVITPNKDAKNDCFVLPQEITDAALIIVNRWGKTVYENHTYKNNWNANNVNAGIYYYLVSDKCSSKNYKGTITVLK